jgi:hypothetical protein
MGWVLVTLAAGLITGLWDTQTTTAVWVVTLVILGIGHGLLLNALNCASQAVVSLPGDEGAAVAMYAFLRSFGMAVGVGVGGSIFQNLMRTALRASNLPTSIAADAEAFVAVLRKMPDTPERGALISAYHHGFRGLFGFFCGIAGLALLISVCLIRHYDMNKKLVTDHRLSDSSKSSKRLNWVANPSKLFFHSQSTAPSATEPGNDGSGG